MCKLLSLRHLLYFVMQGAIFIASNIQAGHFAKMIEVCNISMYGAWLPLLALPNKAKILCLDSL